MDMDGAESIDLSTRRLANYIQMLTTTTTTTTIPAKKGGTDVAKHIGA